MVAVPEVIVGRKLTLEDYCRLPDDQDYEIIEGVLHVSPRARARHQRAAMRISALLVNQAEDKGLGVVVPDADLIVDERSTYVSPDIMFFVTGRFAAVDPDEFIRVIPDLVVEVLSPSTRDYDQFEKRDLYARLGVKHYWIADPDRHQMTEHVLQEDASYRSRTMRAAEVFRPALFPKMEISLAHVLV